jgi:hypothetical protein
MQAGGSWKDWKSVTPGHLKQEIEDMFRDCEPGEYYALVVKCNNPISGYQVIKVKK